MITPQGFVSSDLTSSNFGDELDLNISLILKFLDMLQYSYVKGLLSWRWASKVICVSLCFLLEIWKQSNQACMHDLYVTELILISILSG